MASLLLGTQVLVRKFWCARLLQKRPTLYHDRDRRSPGRDHESVSWDTTARPMAWMSRRAARLYRRDLLCLVVVKPLPGLAAEAAGVDHLFQKRGGPVFRVVEALVEDLHHRQHRVETDQIGECQGSDRVIAAELHAL